MLHFTFVPRGEIAWKRIPQTVALWQERNIVWLYVFAVQNVNYGNILAALAETRTFPNLITAQNWTQDHCGLGAAFWVMLGDPPLLRLHDRKTRPDTLLALARWLPSFCVGSVPIQYSADRGAQYLPYTKTELIPLAEALHAQIEVQVNTIARRELATAAIHTAWHTMRANGQVQPDEGFSIQLYHDYTWEDLEQASVVVRAIFAQLANDATPR